MESEKYLYRQMKNNVRDIRILLKGQGNDLLQKEIEKNLSEIDSLLDKELAKEDEVTLKSILYDMDFELEKDSETGKYKIFDIQTKEYVSDSEGSDLYETKEQIIERMETFINDYWFRELEEELENLDLPHSDWSEMYEQTLLHKEKFKHPEYVTYLDVIKKLVNPSELKIM